MTRRVPNLDPRCPAAPGGEQVDGGGGRGARASLPERRAGVAGPQQPGGGRPLPSAVPVGRVPQGVAAEGEGQSHWVPLLQ